MTRILCAWIMVSLVLLPALAAPDADTNNITVHYNSTSMTRATVRAPRLHFDTPIANLVLDSVSYPVAVNNFIPFYDFKVQSSAGLIEGNHGSFYKHLVADMDYYKSGGRLFRTIYCRVANYPRLPLCLEYWITVFTDFNYVFLRVRLTAQADIELSWRDAWIFGGKGINGVIYPVEGGDRLFLAKKEMDGRVSLSPTKNWLRLFHEGGQGMDVVFSEKAGLSIKHHPNAGSIRIFRDYQTRLKRGESYIFGMILTPTQFEAGSERVRQIAELYTPDGTFNPITLAGDCGKYIEYRINYAIQGRCPVQMPVKAPTVTNVINSVTGRNIPFHFSPEHKTLSMIVDMPGKPFGLKCYP